MSTVNVRDLRTQRLISMTYLLSCPSIYVLVKINITESLESLLAMPIVLRWESDMKICDLSRFVSSSEGKSF